MSSLPFVKDDGSRKFTCFVCGVKFDVFTEYKEHIIQSHDQGREFVICPLERCGAPVRDLRLHYKAKHPSETRIPQTGQMKAMIWKDQNPKTGKMQARKPKFREGYLTSNKNGGKQMHYRSGMECDVYECLEAMNDVVAYEVEPFAVKYSFMGEVHEYNPDLKIIFNDGHTEIWEVKPSNQTTLPKNSAKWESCQQHCEARGYNFMVLTEVGLGKLKQRLKN
jgi:hypothetical protein